MADGLSSLSLIVFAQNEGAVSLYRWLGYKIADRRAVVPHAFIPYTGDCQRRSKISPPGRSKTSPLNVMRYAVLGGCPGSP